MIFGIDMLIVSPLSTSTVIPKHRGKKTHRKKGLGELRAMGRRETKDDKCRAHQRKEQRGDHNFISASMNFYGRAKIDDDL